MFSSYSYLSHFSLLVSFCLVYLVRLVCRLSLFFSVRFVLCYTASFVVCVLVRLLCACRALSISCVVYPLRCLSPALSISCVVYLVCFLLIATSPITYFSFLSVSFFCVVCLMRLVHVVRCLSPAFCSACFFFSI